MSNGYLYKEAVIYKGVRYKDIHLPNGGTFVGTSIYLNPPQINYVNSLKV